MEEFFGGGLIDSVASWLGVSPGLATFLVVLFLSSTIGSFTLIVTRSVIVSLGTQSAVLLALVFTGLLPLWVVLLVLLLPVGFFIYRFFLQDLEVSGVAGIACPECKSEHVKVTHQEAAPDFCECEICGTSFIRSN